MITEICFTEIYFTVIIAGTDPRDKICADVMKRREVKMRWCKTEILVIDEISMLSAEVFDILSFVGKYCTARTRFVLFEFLF